MNTKLTGKLLILNGAAMILPGLLLAAFLDEIMTLGADNSRELVLLATVLAVSLIWTQLFSSFAISMYSDDACGVTDSKKLITFASYLIILYYCLLLGAGSLLSHWFEPFSDYFLLTLLALVVNAVICTFSWRLMANSFNKAVANEI